MAIQANLLLFEPDTETSSTRLESDTEDETLITMGLFLDGEGVGMRLFYSKHNYFVFYIQRLCFVLLDEIIN